jgi:hypothetical protein
MSEDFAMCITCNPQRLRGRRTKEQVSATTVSPRAALSHFLILLIDFLGTVELSQKQMEL